VLEGLWLFYPWVWVRFARCEFDLLSNITLVVAEERDECGHLGGNRRRLSGCTDGDGLSGVCWIVNGTDGGVAQRTRRIQRNDCWRCARIAKDLKGALQRPLGVWTSRAQDPTDPLPRSLECLGGLVCGRLPPRSN
jgi:hypothetical protein